MDYMMEYLRLPASVLAKIAHLDEVYRVLTEFNGDTYLYNYVACGQATPENFGVAYGEFNGINRLTNNTNVCNRLLIY